MQLNMKNFAKNAGGDGAPKHSIDLGSLEENAKFKAAQEAAQGNEGGQEGGQIDNTIEGQEGNQAAQTQANSSSEEEQGNKPEGNQPPEGSSLTNQTSNQQQQVPEITDELILKSLSEKLGKELTSFDELNQPASIELDEQVKALNEWREKTGRPIEDFFKYQKDYSGASDLDIAREALQIEYPTLTSEEINLEMEKFIPTDDDLDNDAARKKLELKKYAAQGRKVLETLKADLGQPSMDYPIEIKSKLQLAEQVQKQMEANKAEQANYMKGINNASNSFETMKLNLSDDLSIDFKVSEDSRKSIPNLINEMPHWKSEDGSWNHSAVVQDAVKIRHFDEIVKLAYQQGLNSGKDGILQQASNSTLGNGIPQGNQQDTGKKKPTIEGIDSILDRLQGGQRIKFGKR